jgi:hypothetical protein
MNDMQNGLLKPTTGSIQSALGLVDISDVPCVIAFLKHAYLIAAGEAIARDVGFRPILDHLSIFGYCQDCLDEAQVGSEKPADPPGMTTK